MRRQGYRATLEEQLDKLGITHAVFDRTEPNPTRRQVHEGADMCREQNCDFVIGLGGGSSIDTAKAIALTVGMGGDLWDYVAGGSGKGQPISRALPIVALPTTAGTGSEISPDCTITNEDTNKKTDITSEHLFPVLAVVDPELTMSIPARTTAFQGFDAFFRAAEAYISKAHTPISDLYALEAIRILYKYLPVAVADSANRWAYIKVAWASTLAAMAKHQSSYTGAHALAYALSAYFPRMSQGTAMVALSQAYFKALKNDAMKRYMKMAEKMTQQKSARPSDFLDALAVMRRECGVTDVRMSDFDVSTANIEVLVGNACATNQKMLDQDPRFLNREELFDIYMQSYR